MKSKFARCAKQDEDRENATSFDDTKRVGEVFSQRAANMANTRCHFMPQMQDMRGTEDDMHGARLYVNRPRIPFVNGSLKHHHRTKEDFVLFALGIYEIIETPHWVHGDTSATHDYSAPHYH